jgi:hypothetical protein
MTKIMPPRETHKQQGRQLHNYIRGEQSIDQRIGCGEQGPDYGTADDRQSAHANRSGS